MKSRLFTILAASAATLVLFFAATWLSCNKDRCVTVHCNNGGACSNGQCTCATGFEGPNCSTQSRQKFLGNWQQIGSASGKQSDQFAVSVNGGVAANSITVVNFDNYFTDPVTGTMSSADTLVFHNQTVQGCTVWGGAWYTSSTTIMLSYTITSPSGVNRSISTEWVQ